jgi:hypothetical protein
MSRIEALVQRYEAVDRLLRDGAEIVAVADPPGARYNAALRRLLFAARDEPGVWDDLIRPAKALRWRRVTHLQSTACQDAVAGVVRQAGRLYGAVADKEVLDELLAAARTVADVETPVADAFLGIIGQVDPAACVLVAASRPAQASLLSVWGPFGVRVLTAADLAREETCAQRAYAVGPPRFFGLSLVTAPAAFSVSFLIPSWVRDRTIPVSVLSGYLDEHGGTMRIASRITADPADNDPAPAPVPAESAEDAAISEFFSETADDLLPQPFWAEPKYAHREPGSDEVAARKVLLSGSWAIWLDDADGERIRTVDPAAPGGERVIYVDVRSVQPGTYLLLRQGASEHDALREVANRLLGAQALAIDGTQRAWKEKLARRLAERGRARVEEELRRHGVRAASRAPAWAGPALIRPSSEDDFRLLLHWLGIADADLAIANATRLRRAHHRAGSDIREKLEKAVEAADLAALERDGHLRLGISADGFRTMTAARVLAISPHTEIVSHHHARVLFRDGGALWLE